MEISQIVSLAALGVFFLFMTVGFFKGVLKGLKKASLRLGVFAFTTIVAFLITPMISKLAMNVDLSFAGIDGSLSQFIQTQINQQPQIADFLASSTTMQSFVDQLPYLVLNLITFTIVFFAMGFVGFIVYQILKTIFLRKKKPKEWKDSGAYKVALEDKKPSKHRLLGGLLGAIQSVAFITIMLLPISGFATLVYDVAFQTENVAHAADPEYSAVASLAQEYIPQEVLDSLKAYKLSPLGISSKIVGTDTYMFDGLTKVKIATQEGNLNISYRSEILHLTEIYNNLEFLTELDIENIVYKDLDYAKIEKAVDVVFESRLLKAIAPEVLNWVVIDLNRPQADQVLDLNLGSQETQMINLVVSEYETTFGSVYKGIRNDFETVVQVAVGAGKSGLVDEALNESIDLDAIKNILQANNKEVINTTFSNLFKAISLRVVGVEAINMMFDQISSTVALSPVSYQKVNWDGVISDMTSVSNNILDILVNISDEFSGGIQEVITENPFELINADTTLLTTKLGIIMSTIQNTNLLVDANGNKVVYGQLMDYLNTTEFSEYVDFVPFKQANAWPNEMANLNNILLAVKRSGILSDVINNIETPEEIDFSAVLKKLGATDSGTSQTYTYNILNSVLSSNAFKKLINVGFDMLNDVIAQNQTMLGAGVDLGKVQGSKLSTEQEKAYILSFFDNIVSYVSDLEWNGDQSQLINAILSSNLSKLGLALDAIENSAVFGSYTEGGIIHDGVYVSLITALNNNNQISNFVDFAIVLDSSFDGWNVEFTRIQTILENVQNIEVGSKTLIQAIIDGDLDGSNITSLVENLTEQDVENLIDPIIDSQLLSKNITMFVDTINQMVADFTSSTIASVSPTDVIDQKQDVKEIVKQALGLTNILTTGFDENTLKDNATVIGNFLNTLKDNKNSFANPVFGETYDAIVNYLQSDPTFGATVSDLLNEYNSVNDVDWAQLLELFMEIGNQDFAQGFTTEFKTLLADLFATMKQDQEYSNIVIEVMAMLESFTNLDGVNTIEDFVVAYTSALDGLAQAQGNFALGSAEFATRAGVVFDFFNSFIPGNTFDISEFKLITDFSAEIASANAFQIAMTSFDNIDFDNDDINDINNNIDALLNSLATSQLFFTLIEDSSVGVGSLDSNAKTIVSNRIDESYSGEMRDRLNAFFGI